MKRVVLLGSTGSIGTSTLKVVEDQPDRLQLVGLAAGGNADLLVEQCRRHRPRLASLNDASKAGAVQAALEGTTRVLAGPSALVELATMPEADVVLIAIVGTAGLEPALAAIRAGKDIAVASKEILVMAGETVMNEARAHGVKVLAVDSEHSAIFQCLDGKPADSVRNLWLTASGGPFRDAAKWPAESLAAVTVEQALKHPSWVMGRKITIDSATLFNKGLEMIEARWLFDVPMSRIELVVHPESIVHSMVEFRDRSVLAQLSHSDMCFPIQYAVTWPERVPNDLRPLDFAQLGALHFEAPRTQDFPALDLARQAGETGGTLPAVLNAANEVAVQAFLDGRLGFPAIWRTVAAVMEAHAVTAHPGLGELIEADAWARRAAADRLG